MMNSEAYRHKVVETPLGPLLVETDPWGVCRIGLPGRDVKPRGDAADTLPFRAQEQLEAYFGGKLRDFSLPLSLTGSPFSLRVWQACLTVGYGQTVSYGELARRMGAPGACRAVGAALGRNPVPLLVPCHRVVGEGGQPTGFAGGIPLKKALLELERRALCD